ncbi:TonB-dependent receptor [Catenovulum sp. 2E275]|uniref:TonB-dependent receptor n=1 Tax=Catenovulum sp. 2E275 TaxID=2980497 RepID=UPI0021CFFA86|nr:TonB-dependent receptor [Catenovulum sp. 2E275]MCU4677202.1 TonB-dependent receptor [Catenovulum sp. 2E275]
MRHNKYPFIPTALSLAIATSFTPFAFAQEDTEQTEEQIQQAKKDAEVIEVKGLRSSLIKAQEIKMTSDSFVDAVVAEDIGKLPDVTAAESLARITGVQVDRFNDEASAVLIRGLPDVTTTYNGREFFTAENRRASLQDFPAQALAGIEVYKSATAKLVEPGLAGLVNVRTRRPFDFEGEKIAGGFHLGYNDQSEKTAPSGNLLYSNRWDTSIGEIGFLGNVTYAKSEFYNGVRYNATWFKTAEETWDNEAPYEDGGFVFPARVGLYNSAGKRTRPSANMAIQWRPNDQLEVYFDGIYQGYRGRNQVDNFWFALGENDWLNGTGTPKYTDIVMVDGTDDQVKSFTQTGSFPPEFTRSAASSNTDTYQFAVGAIWKNDRIKIETDLAYTDSKYDEKLWNLDGMANFSPTVVVDFFGDGGALFSAPDWDVTDESTYNFRGYYESRHNVSGSGIQWRTDATIDTELGDWLHTIETGFRYSDRDATRSSGSRYSGWLAEDHIPMSDLPFLEMELSHDPFRTDKQGFTQYMSPSRDSIAGNADKLQAFVYDLLIEKGSADASLWNQPIADDPANEWLAKEKTYAVYLQGKSFFEVGNVGVDLFTGVRIAHTEGDNRGIANVDVDGVQTLEPRVSSNSFTDVLPNISFRAQLTDDLQLRAGFTQTVTKPNFGDMNPALTITEVTSSNDPDGEKDFDAEGSGGNPNLKSLTSDNYDISLEYYFSDSGYLSAAAFYKDLWGFTNWYTRYVETPDYGLVKLNRPENTGEGKLKGWEISGQTFFDFDFMPTALHYMGITANMTMLEGETRRPNEDGTFGPFDKITGLSKYTYNAAIFYEREGFSTRLSYNLRDTWVNWYGATSPDGDFVGNKTRARNRLDFSIGYEFNEHLTVYFDMANILAKPFKNFTVMENGVSFPQDVRDEGRYYGGGFRFNF